VRFRAASAIGSRDGEEAQNEHRHNPELRLRRLALKPRGDHNSVEDHRAASAGLDEERQ
jgi:hypothetical protein